jgi:hypothetical protein
MSQLSSLRRVRGAAGRAAGGAARGPMRNTSPDRAPRTLHKLVGPWGAPGPPIGATHPQPAMAAGVAHATGGSSAVRTPARYPAQPPGRFGHSGPQCRAGKFGRGTGRPPEGLQPGLGKNVLLKGGLQPLPGRGPAAAVFRAGGALRGGIPARTTRPRGPATARRDPGSGDRSRWLDRPHQQSDRRGLPPSTDTGDLGRPDGARAGWRVSPTPGLGPWRPCESVPGVLPAPPRASDRPRPLRPARVPGGRGRPAPGRGAAAVAQPARRRGGRQLLRREQRSLASTRKDQRAGGNPRISEEKRQPTIDHDPAASLAEGTRWTDPLP